MDELPAWIGRLADKEDWSAITRESIREAFCERLGVTSLTTDGDLALGKIAYHHNSRIGADESDL